LEKYNTILKPKIAEFKDTYGKTPNQSLKDFVDSYIEKNNLQNDFIGRGFHFKGRGLVHKFTWAGINLINTEGLNPNLSPITQLPQLYLTIDNEDIYFGFSYGNNTKDDDIWVQRIRDNPELLRKIIRVKQEDPELFIRGNEILEDGSFGESIEINSFADLTKNWSKSIWISKKCPSEKIDENIDKKITDTFDKLKELFIVSSTGEFSPSFHNEKKGSIDSSPDPISSGERKQVILYGPPGTGKTFNAIVMAHELLFGSKNPSATCKQIKGKLSSREEKEIDPSGLSWIDAIILAFDELKNDKISVNEIKNSRIIQEFSVLKNNRTISNSIWHFLLFESALDSETVKVKNRGSQELFDKDIESKWFLTEKGKIYLENLKEDLKSFSSHSTSQFSFITFHQSYSYEDFIEGIRPNVSDATLDGQILYQIKDGLFKEICKKALQDPTKKFVLIIDEINRGNISKIFGEAITLLEENKRIGETEEITVRLPYSGDEFGIPNNVYLIGTMNSTDKSIALVDIALRRRFHFERLSVKLSEIQNDDARKLLESMNRIICALKNPDYEIGHSYFMKIPKDDPDNQELSIVFVTQILPLIEEYFFNDWEALATILGKDSIIIEKQKKIVWNEDDGTFEENAGNYDKIYSRCLAPPDEIFKNSKINLERLQTTMNRSSVVREEY
jgi:Cdc6-like AAA superfamily ATPase